MSLNKVITSVNALVNSVSIPANQLNNVVCIDTLNNRIGVKTANPSKEIDISGMLKTNNIYINNKNNSTSDFDIIYDNSFLTFSGGLKVNNDISCIKIDCSLLKINEEIIDDINKFKLQHINDCSFGSVEMSNLLVYDYVSLKNNLDVSGNVTIDLSLNVNGNIEGKKVIANGVLLTSDDRYKHNERNINNGLEIIRQLQPQIYDKTSTFKTENYRGLVNEPYFVEAGLIAQEVFAINDLSFAVIEGNTIRPYHLNYDNIFVYGLAGIKELDTIVSSLSNRLDNLSNNTLDMSDINLSNIKNLIISQNRLIQTLNTKITSLETRINNLEK
tara:strand:- start:330 stop:1319 length:990 start_codon:yes stop_codon:yes gene_type:complete